MYDERQQQSEAENSRNQGDAPWAHPSQRGPAWDAAALQTSPGRFSVPWCNTCTSSPNRQIKPMSHGQRLRGFCRNLADRAPEYL